MNHQLSAEEASRSYAKYFYRSNATLSPSILKTLVQKELPARVVLKRDELNRLIEPGYHEVETGYRKNENGSVYVAALTQMPHVTTAMLDWWFWWHAAESLRYKIWYPEAHFGISSDFHGFYDDPALSYAEKLHGSVHTVNEDIGTGPGELIIDFMSPADFGFDTSEFKNSKVGTVICARVAAPKEGVWMSEMCHFVRETSEGVEMRSRFWIGDRLKRMKAKENSLINKIINLPFLKKRLLPKDIGKQLLHHCVQEYHNLASFLPALYLEEHNRKSDK